MTRRKPRIYFDVEAPHRKPSKPLAYHFPFLAKIHLKGPHRKHKKAALYTGAFGLVVVLILAFQIPALFANVRSFAPATCSGDWSNPTALLEGEVGGAAVATDPGQKIFCSFASLNLKEPVVLERTMLVLSFESPLVQESNPTSEVQEEESGETPEEPAPTEEESAPPAEESSEPIPEPVVEEPASVEEPAPEPASEPVQEAPTEAPAAFLFTAVAHAQEAETTVEPAPVEEPEPAPVEETPAEEPITEEVVPAEEEPVEEQTGEPVEESTPIDVEPEGSELTISYTVDGEIWTEVTTFTPRGNEVTFDLAVPTTAEFERLVIRLTADSIVKNIELSDMEVRIWTETPLDELLQPFPVEEVVGSHVFNREFTIDPNATHYCVFDPLTVDLSSGTTTTFMLSLKKGDDLGQGVSGFIADVSEAVLEVITDEPPPEPEVEEVLVEVPEEPVASTTEETKVEEQATEEPIEEIPEEVAVEEIASTTEEVVVEEVALTTEEEEQGIIEEIVESGIEALEELARIRVGMLEIGSLPVGIDIRFTGETPYVVELFDDSPDTFTLSANVFAPEGAQEGSFSVPLVFTRTDGKESTVVCQINVINRPGSVPMYVPEEPTSEPEVPEEPAPAIESVEEPVL